MAISKIGTSSIDQSTPQQIGGITVGRGAGDVATNTAVGTSALSANTTGSVNTAVGYGALQTNDTGVNNTAVGLQALRYNTTGGNNAAVSYGALYSNTTGGSNTAVGTSALQANTTASNNTAVGYQAGYSNTVAGYTVAIGYQAGYNYNRTADANNGYNTFVGPFAGYYNTTGRANTILGGYNGNQGGLDIRTASNYIVLSDGDGNPRGIFDSSGSLILGATAISGAEILHVERNTASQEVARFYNSNNSAPWGISIQYTAAAPNSTGSSFWGCYDTGGTRAYMRSNGGLSNYQANNTNLSDRREKTNFAPAGDYLEKICAIPVQTFNYIDQNMEEDGGLTLGVIAQDVQEVAPELVMESNWANKEDEPKMRLSIYQTDLQYALMKAIQELNAKVEAQAAEIAALKGTN